MRLSELEPEYLTYLATQQGCSPNTIRTYRSSFARCRRASAALGVPEPDTDQVDRAWANRLVQQLGKELRPRTVHRNITAWRGLLAYAIEQGYAERNPLAGVKLPKKGAVRRTPVTTEDLQELLAATGKLLNPVRACMARALLLTAGTAATRYSDLIPLRVSDLDLAAGMVTIRKGKGDKSRTIPLPAQTVEALRQWLQVRRRWLDTWETSPRRTGSVSSSRRVEPEALWLADRGRPLGEDGLRRYLQELCLIAGIDRPIRLHDLRHCAATRMARQGVPLVGIQAILGHTSLMTTQSYIAGAGSHLQEWAERMGLPSRQATPSPEHEARYPVGVNRSKMPPRRGVRQPHQRTRHHRRSTRHF